MFQFFFNLNLETKYNAKAIGTYSVLFYQLFVFLTGHRK